MENSAAAFTSPDTIYLVCTGPHLNTKNKMVNNNKYYKLQLLGNGDVQTSFGKIGGIHRISKPTTFGTFEIGRKEANRLLKDKVKKGYKVTAMPEANEAVVPKAKKATSPKTKKATSPKTKKASSPKTKKATSPKTKKATSPKTKKATSPKTKKATSSKTKKATVPNTNKAGHYCVVS